jgi:hypothetical protein
MNRDLNIELAEKVMGWRLAPDRYLTGGRSWKPHSQFRPTERINDSFTLLDAAGVQELILRPANQLWSAQVCVHGIVGKAQGVSRPEAISLAVAAAVGIAVGTSKA